MRLPLLLSLASLLLVAGISQPALADVKVGVVDFTRALDETEQDGALKTLKEDAAERQRKLDKLEDEIVDMEQDLQENGPLLAKDKMKEALVAYQEKALEYRKTLVQFEQEYAEKRQEVLGKVHRKFSEIAVEIAQDNGVQLMLERSESAVLYFDRTYDYTDELVKRYKATKK